MAVSSSRSDWARTQAASSSRGSAARLPRRHCGATSCVPASALSEMSTDRDLIDLATQKSYRNHQQCNSMQRLARAAMLFASASTAFQCKQPVTTCSSREGSAPNMRSQTFIRVERGERHTSAEQRGGAEDLSQGAASHEIKTVSRRSVKNQNT